MAGEERASAFLKRVYTAEIDTRSAKLSLQAHDSFIAGQRGKGVVSDKAAIAESESLEVVTTILVDFALRFEQAGIAELTVGTLARYLPPKPEAPLAAPDYHPASTTPPGGDNEMSISTTTTFQPIQTSDARGDGKRAVAGTGTSEKLGFQPTPQVVTEREGINLGNGVSMPDRLVAVLRANPNGLPGDALLDRLYPGEGRAARQKLYQIVNRARRGRLGPGEQIAPINGMYRLFAPDGQVVSEPTAQDLPKDDVDTFLLPAPDTQNGLTQSSAIAEEGTDNQGDDRSSGAFGGMDLTKYEPVLDTSHGQVALVPLELPSDTSVFGEANPPVGAPGIKAQGGENGTALNGESPEPNRNRLDSDRKRVNLRFAREILSSLRGKTGLVGLSQEPIEILEVTSPEQAIIARSVFAGQNPQTVRKVFVADLLSKIERYWDVKPTPGENIPREQAEMIGSLLKLRRGAHHTRQEIIQLICGHFDFPLPNRYTQAVKKN